MSVKSWLKRATHIPHDAKGILGNLVKNVSPLVAFTPLGALGAAGVSATGDLIRGKRNLRDIATGALTNASLGVGARGLARHAGFVGGGGASPTATAAGGDATAVAPAGGDALAAAPDLTPAGIPTSAVPAVPTASPSYLNRVAGSTGRFIEHNPTAVAMGLQSLGNLATAGTENRMNEAQARLLESQVTETADQRRRREAQDRFFNNGQLSLAPMDVRANPYT